MVRLKRILCPIDFFPASSKVFDYALKLAANYAAAIHALHVVEPVTTTYDTSLVAPDLIGKIEKESRKELEKFKKRGAKARVPVSAEVCVGTVDREILRAVSTRKADLVVMGTHGRRGFERLLLGSVTERMIRRCPVPLMIIGTVKRTIASPPHIRRILLTTDFSDATTHAVAYALSIAQECQAKITFLHVLNDVAADVIGTYRDALVNGIEIQMQRLIPEDALDWCRIEARVETGLPTRVIPKVVTSGAFDLLVMNIHGKKVLDRVLIGSTAERILRAAAGVCPVLLIPPMGVRNRKT